MFEPKLKRTEAYSLRLSVEEKEKLEAIAKLTGHKVADLIRLAIRIFIENDQTRRNKEE